MPHAQPDGYLAVPSTGTGHGVLVLHAWWGLNDTIKAFCTRLADSGFVAFAPDLYHGKVADNIADAETLGSALDANHLQAKAEIAEATQIPRRTCRPERPRPGGNWLLAGRLLRAGSRVRRTRTYPFRGHLLRDRAC